jgi:hypothetical protein
MKIEHIFDLYENNNLRKLVVDILTNKKQISELKSLISPNCDYEFLDGIENKAIDASYLKKVNKSNLIRFINDAADKTGQDMPHKNIQRFLSNENYVYMYMFRWKGALSPKEYKKHNKIKLKFADIIEIYDENNSFSAFSSASEVFMLDGGAYRLHEAINLAKELGVKLTPANLQILLSDISIEDYFDKLKKNKAYKRKLLKDLLVVFPNWNLNGIEKLAV